ncbi:uncharacterized protein CEXT_436651 [Caerostris extrusa]|uniref:Uncharacterized protein n=1 Tax=Caerostris extrusa TaxID=172846 RepID=A0AAV4WMD9_CAEEX|nr:uncharacterized protein CEXT_436651 [Caerostris extrusa]
MPSGLHSLGGFISLVETSTAKDLLKTIMFAKVVIFCVALAAAHASLIGTYGLGAPVLAAGPLGLGKGLIAAPAVATVSSQRTAINHVAPAAAIGAAAPIALANGLVAGNGLLANGLYGRQREFSPTESSLETASSPTDSSPDTESPHPSPSATVFSEPLRSRVGKVGLAAPLGLGLGLGKAIY